MYMVNEEEVSTEPSQQEHVIFEEITNSDSQDKEILVFADSCSDDYESQEEINTTKPIDESLAIEALRELSEFGSTQTTTVLDVGGNCQFCGEFFEKLTELSNHIVCHSVKRPHSCRICGKLFIRKSDYQTHLKNHEDVTLNCLMCGATFSKSSSLANHIKIHLKGSSTPPPTPMAVVPPQSMIIESTIEPTPITVINPNKPNICRFCNLSFSRVKALISHEKIHETHDWTDTYDCRSCPRKFRHLHNWIKHSEKCNSNTMSPPPPPSSTVQIIKIKTPPTEAPPTVAPPTATTHTVAPPTAAPPIKIKTPPTPSIEPPSTPQLRPPPTTPPPQITIQSTASSSSSSQPSQSQTTTDRHPCLKCSKSFSTNQKMVRHMWIHRKKAHSCETCAESFISQIELEQHRLSKHSDGNAYLCKKCGKSFASRQGLWEHNRSHENNGENPVFKCTECNKGFNSRQGFLIHNRTHTGERPYVCNYCPKAFRDGSTLKKHERIHTGERPHKCPLCKQAFNQKVVLREHIRWVHAALQKDRNVTDHICSLCNMKFTDREELCTHIVKHSDQIAALTKNGSAGSNRKTIKSVFDIVVPASINQEMINVKDSRNDLNTVKKNRLMLKNGTAAARVGRTLQMEHHDCEMCGKRFLNKNLLYKHTKQHI